MPVSLPPQFFGAYIRLLQSTNYVVRRQSLKVCVLGGTARWGAAAGGAGPEAGIRDESRLWCLAWKGQLQQRQRWSGAGTVLEAGAALVVTALGGSGWGLRPLRTGPRPLRQGRGGRGGRGELMAHRWRLAAEWQERYRSYAAATAASAGSAASSAVPYFTLLAMCGLAAG